MTIVSGKHMAFTGGICIGRCYIGVRKAFDCLSGPMQPPCWLAHGGVI